MYRALLDLSKMGFTPSGVLDVGAYEGQFSRGIRKIWPEAQILMIDALTENDSVLSAVCKEIGNAKYLITLLGEKEIEQTSFFVANTEINPNLVKTGSSKYKENAAFQQDERLLQQTTLAQIVSIRNPPYQLLKLDVQGAELEVIRGLGRYLSMVDIILMEMSLVDYNNGAPLIGEVLSEVRQLGFVLFDIVEEHRFNNRLFQIDGLFVRPSSTLRPQPPFWA